ncbi:MAG: hypothetical protein JJ971_08310 [Balneolaceae bacterium]|nr:hypothetical protein [Balneolaceae bacterium]MBO6523812.1 hypothetical protein [Balneolaceae bacterium]MBO6546759.1 hypothetical protein [Balneolaceae bacterium]MBO6546760.1 hypothetical protein [Balneolaceae bacterium]MBO6649117.1 hypothetical protein [Balneolaceae bacterium]
MKSLKSLFALLTLVAVSFACAPAQQSQATAEADQVETTTITITDDAVFSGGNDPKPILNKPKI